MNKEIICLFLTKTKFSNNSKICYASVHNFVKKDYTDKF